MELNMSRWEAMLCGAALAIGRLWGGGVEAWGADPWADAFINASMISDPSSSTTINLAAALGPPTLVTDPGGLYGGVVTPLNPPFGPGELISIGEGGWLTVRFDEPVTDDVRNPYGVDLLIFGNAFIGGDLFNADFSFKPAGLAAGVASEGGLIEVSSDGKNFFPVGGEADGLFPTNAFADVEHPFAAAPGRIEADFTKPVNPAFSPVGKTFAQIIAGYEGSGGGCGVDIAAAGLSSISYVRITNPTGSGVTPEIDALADVTAVPEPGGAALFLVFSVLFAWQKRARRYGEERGGFVAGIA